MPWSLSCIVLDVAVYVAVAPALVNGAKPISCERKQSCGMIDAGVEKPLVVRVAEPMLSQDALPSA